MAMSWQSGAEDVTVDNVHTLGDFLRLLSRALVHIQHLKDEVEQTATGTEQQMAQLRADLRIALTAAQPIPGAGAPRDDQFELIDVKAICLAVFNGLKAENFRRGRSG